MKQFPTLLILFSFFFLSSSFGQDDIYSKFGLEKDGCNIYTIEKEIEKEIKNPPRPSKPTKPESKKEERLLDLFSDFKSFLTENNPLELRPLKEKELDNGNILFHENNFWGIKNKTGRNIVHPIWSDAEITDKGIIAYEGVQCYYYDFNGRKIYKNASYYMETSPWGHTIFQTKDGFGILDEDMNILIQPQYLNISTKKDRRNNPSFYLAKNTANKTSIILPNGKIISNKNTTINNIKVIGDYIYRSGKNANIIDTKTGNPIACNDGIQIYSVDEERKLAALSDVENKLNYLINYEGKIINKQGFNSISKFSKEGYALANVETKKEEEDSKILNGIINTNGEWIIEPSYDNISKNGNSWSIIKRVANTRNQTMRLINNEGEIILDYKYNNIIHINNDLYLLVTRVENERSYDIFDATEKKIIKKNVPYSRISRLALQEKKQLIITKQGVKNIPGKKSNTEAIELQCKKTIYKAVNKNGKHVLLNTLFESISEREYINIRTEAFEETFQIICMNIVNDVNISSVDIYNCNGELIEKDKTIDVANPYNSSSEDKVISYSYDKETDSNFITNKNGENIPIKFGVQEINNTIYTDLYIVRNGYWDSGLITSEGKLVLSPSFDSFHFSFDGFSFITGIKSGYITKDGDLLFGKTFNSIYQVSKGVFVIMENNYWSVVDSGGNVLVEPTNKMINKHGGLIFDGNDYYDLEGKIVN